MSLEDIVVEEGVATAKKASISSQNFETNFQVSVIQHRTGLNRFWLNSPDSDFLNGPQSF